MLNSQTSFEIQVTENYNKHNIHLICYQILRLISSRSNTHSAFSSLFTEIFRCQLFYYYYFFFHLFYFFISSWWWMRCMMGQNENCAMDSGSCSVLLTNVKVKDFSFKKLIPLFSFCVIWYEAISQFFISIQNYKRNWCPQGIKTIVHALTQNWFQIKSMTRLTTSHSPIFVTDYQTVHSKHR